MYFLEPIWLWALGAIAIPIWVHFWRIRQGRTLRIGSVALLEESTRQKSGFSLPRELFLLMLRCLLIALLSFLLARPVFERRAPSLHNDWFLVEPGFVTSAYQQYKVQIDSLQAAGAEFHYFTNGFPVGDLQEEMAQKTNRLKSREDSLGAKNKFLLLAQLDRVAPLAKRLSIFSTHHLLDFSGERPNLQHRLSFYPISVNDSSSWTASSYLTNEARVVTIQGTSDANGVEYSKIENDGLQDVQPTPAIDTFELQVLIYSEAGNPDAKFLSAALEAIQQYTGRRIKIKEREASGFEDQPCDWLFWLSQKDMPLNSARRVFVFEDGIIRHENSWLYETGVNRPQNLRLMQTIIPADSNILSQEFIWEDGYGNPVLTFERNGEQALYHFMSRFQPAWNDLPWSERFPSMLLELLLNGYKGGRDQSKDRRVIDVKLLQYEGGTAAKKYQPREANEPVQLAKDKELPEPNLGLWLAAFIVFVSERLVTWNQQKRA